MCRRQEELLDAGRELGRFPSDSSAIARSQAGIDDERRTAADDNGDVWPALDRPNMFRDLDRVLPEHGLSLSGEEGDGKRPQEQSLARLRDLQFGGAPTR